MYGAHPGYALSYGRVRKKHRDVLERFHTLYDIDIPPNSGTNSNRRRSSIYHYFISNSSSNSSNSSNNSKNESRNERENRTTLSYDLKKYVNNSLFSDITILFGNKVIEDSGDIYIHTYLSIYPFYSINILYIIYK